MTSILVYAKTLLPEAEAENLKLGSWMDCMQGKSQALSLEALAQECYYSLTNSSVITARSIQTGKEKYHSYRMLFCRSRSRYETWTDQSPSYHQRP